MVPFCSPIGEVYHSRLRPFPSLVNCCTIDWFSEWPDEALCSVASSFMQDITEIDTTDTVKGLVCLPVCRSIWQSIGYCVLLCTVPQGVEGQGALYARGGGMYVMHTVRRLTVLSHQACLIRFP